MIYTVLFVFAAATVHFVSWVGSVLHSVPNGGESGYAVFTFRGDQNKPMTVNMLMNILFPNIILIFLYWICFKNRIEVGLGQLFYYVCFYYIYRVLLICFILKRRELLSVPYELTNSALGILAAYFLTKKFLVDSQQIFIPLSELINEFWLVMIVLVYKFIGLLFDKVFRQKTVVNEGMLDSYIRNKFRYFYKKYRNVVYISREDNGIWILLFAILIFENYNRGKIIRAAERVKVQLGFSATVGIMQIRSDKNISDEESISLAYEKLKHEIVGGNISTADEMEIHHYAFQYNPDEDYAKSVSFVYQHLYDYLNSVPHLQHEFYLADFVQEQEEESPEMDEAFLGAGREEQYLTIDDVVMMTGLSKKQVWKKIKKKKVTVFFEADEVTDTFRKEIGKG